MDYSMKISISLRRYPIGTPIEQSMESHESWMISPKVREIALFTRQMFVPPYSKAKQKVVSEKNNSVSIELFQVETLDPFLP